MNGNPRDFNQYDALLSQKWVEIQSFLDGKSVAGRCGPQIARIVSACKSNEHVGWAKPGLKTLMRIADGLGFDTKITFVRRSR